MKSRKIKAYSGFRGLDLENRANKVAPFRASAGYNFRLESDMLRTRPAMISYKDLPFVLAESESLIGFYEYCGCFLYITNNEIYLYDPEQINEEIYKLSNAGDFITNIGGFVFDYDKLYQPVFQEEKDALFIFGLNAIYVLSIYSAYEERFFAFYDLKNKPLMAFENEEVTKWYEDLPTPYVPTLTIGERVVDDVNLLSPLSKYQIFTSLEESNDFYKKYFLPSHYDEKKHGPLNLDKKDINSNINITFYNDKYNNIDNEITVFPVFLGIEADNFGDYNDFGVEIDDLDEPIRINEVYYTKKISEYRKFNDDDDEIITVSEKVGLTKEEFFKMTIADGGEYETVFERLMLYIKENSSSGGKFVEENQKVNYLVGVLLNVELQVRIVDGETGYLLEEKTQRKEMKVWVQFKRFDVSLLATSLVAKDGAGEYIEGKLGEGHPTTPVAPVLYSNQAQTTIISTDEDHTLVSSIYKNIISQTPISKNSVTPAMIKEMNKTAEAIISNEIKKSSSGIDNDDIVRVNNTLTLRRDYFVAGTEDLVNIVVLQNAVDVQSNSFPVPIDEFRPYLNPSSGIELSFNGQDHYELSGNYRFGDLNFGESSSPRVLAVKTWAGGTVAFFLGDAQLGSGFEYVWQYGTGDTDYLGTRTRNFDNYEDSVMYIGVQKVGGYYLAGQGGGSCYPMKYSCSIIGRENYFLNYVPGLKTKIANAVKDYVNGQIDLTGTVKVRFKIKYSLNYPKANEFSDYYYTFELDYQWAKQYNSYEEKKFIYSYAKRVTIETSEIKNRLYDFNISEQGGGFDLRVRDFFFDYNGKPSVDVRVRFNENPDYNIIAASKFGITFGGENRLFLAGNKEYPHIDRYNVSNDLLGNNVKNQSYELSYFPSKNYRVMGGKGAINGYVIATDEMMYVTKEDYAGDTKLFVRRRVLDEEGLIYYNDTKTSIKETPLNHKCLVRFNNDIVMLSKNGLFGIELTSGLITDERMLKPRDGYVNKDLKAQIKKAKIPFIIEDNKQMMVVLENIFYVADSRYLSQNTLGVVDNTSYEIIKWLFPHNEFTFGGIDKDEKMFFIDDYSSIYTLDENENSDIVSRVQRNALSIFDNKNFVLPSTFDYIFNDPEKYRFVFNAKRLFAKRGISYNYTEDEDYATFYFLIPEHFRSLKDGDRIFDDNFDEGTTVFGLEESGRTSLKAPGNYIYSPYVSVLENAFYIIKINEEPVKSFMLSPYPGVDPDLDINEYILSEVAPISFKLQEKTAIEMLWVSNIDDFDSPLMEKTLYRLTIGVNRQSLDNSVQFGYRTMRRLNTMQEKAHIDVSGGFDFESMDFRTLSLTTFGKQGISLPLKENNFLNVQFIIKAIGQVEIDAFYLIYKNNRMLKSIG